MGKSAIDPPLAAWSDAVRESSLKRFRQVRPDDWSWRPRPDLLSFADVLKHLADADRWLFERLDGGPPSEGVVIRPGDGNGCDCARLLEEFTRLGAERTRRISSCDDQDFQERRFSLCRRGTVSLFDLIVRCNLDHETHHRGALQLALRLRYG